jgi:urease accessory protein
MDGAPALASVVVRAGPGRSDVIRGRGAGPLRLLFPRAAGKAAWIVTSSLGGGLVDGDDVTLDVEVEPGATCLVTTQSSTKVYRGSARQRLDVRVRGDGCAIVVPDPVVAFRDARFTQATTIGLDAGASLVLADIVTAGRIAYGERWSAARIDSALSIAIAGVPRLHDRIVLDRDDGEVAARMRRFEAIATAVLIGPRLEAVAHRLLARLATERVVADADVVVAASPLADGVVCRIAAREVAGAVATVRELLGEACLVAGEDPWARRW